MAIRRLAEVEFTQCGSDECWFFFTVDSYIFCVVSTAFLETWNEDASSCSTIEETFRMGGNPAWRIGDVDVEHNVRQPQPNKHTMKKQSSSSTWAKVAHLLKKSSITSMTSWVGLFTGNKSRTGTVQIHIATGSEYCTDSPEKGKYSNTVAPIGDTNKSATLSNKVSQSCIPAYLDCSTLDCIWEWVAGNWGW